MSCSPHDLRDYILKELDAGARSQVERHLRTCGACRLEAERLRLTEAALHSLRDEEIPTRIAFVSDKIFEPSLLLRWWRAGWAPAGVLIAAAIVFAAVYRPAPVAVQSALNPAQVRAEIAREVAQAVAAVEERQARRTAELLAAAEKRYALERQADRLAAEEAFMVLQKRLNVSYLASNYAGATQ
jgi:anti-sigma factor RsiW